MFSSLEKQDTKEYIITIIIITVIIIITSNLQMMEYGQETHSPTQEYFSWGVAGCRGPPTRGPETFAPS